MWVPGRDRLVAYREFCALLQGSDQRVCLDRVIQFHLDTATAHTGERTGQPVDAIWQLSTLLDDCVGGGQSIQSRLQAEEAALD
jgi:hypothetical protein